MHSIYLCPLTAGSTFSLSRLGVQRNCNATDTEAVTCEDDRSSQSYRPQLKSSAGGVFTGGGVTSSSGVARGGDSSTFYKHVGFAANTCGASCGLLSSRSSHQLRHQNQNHNQQLRRLMSGSCSIGTSGGGGGGGGGGCGQSASRRLQHAEERRTSGGFSGGGGGVGGEGNHMLLVPLVSHSQSNLLRLANHSANNAQEQPPAPSADTKVAADKETNGCDTGGTARPGGGGSNLLAGSGVPYWNIYEYQDFRELQHGNGHIFDAQTDPCLHREGIILDSYNRLNASCSKFRRPVPMYHVR